MGFDALGSLACFPRPRRVSPRQASSFWLDPKGTKRSSPHCARPSPSARGSRLCGKGRGRAETPCVRAAHFGQTVCPGQFTWRANARTPAFATNPAAQRGRLQQPNPAIGPLPAVSCLRFGTRLLGLAARGSPLCAAEQHSEPARVPKARHPSSSASLFERSEPQANGSEFWPGLVCEQHREPRSRRRRGERSAGLTFCPLLGQAKSGSPARAKSGRAATQTL